MEKAHKTFSDLLKISEVLDAIAKDLCDDIEGLLSQQVSSPSSAARESSSGRIPQQSSSTAASSTRASSRAFTSDSNDNGDDSGSSTASSVGEDTADILATGLAQTTKRQQKWYTRFQELVEFQREHNHCLVPLNWPQNRPLARWGKRDAVSI